MSSKRKLFCDSDEVTSRRGFVSCLRNRGLVPKETLLVLIGVIIVIGVLAFAYGPALGLPHSLIDDELHLTNSQRFVRNVTERGLTQALQEDVSIRLRLLNPGYTVATAVLYSMSGSSPYHGWKLFSLGLVCGLLMLLPWIGLRSVVKKDFTANLAGAVAAALFLLLGEYPGHSDLQSLQANWYRLHTTDSMMVVFQAFHFVFLFAALHASRRWAILWGTGAVASFALALSVKPTAGVLLVPAALVTVALLLSGERRRAWRCALITLFSGLYAALSLGWLMYLASQGTGEAYGQSYSLAPEHLREGLRFFARTYWHFLGPLALWLPAVMLARVWQEWKESRNWRTLLEKHLLLIYLLACWGVITAAYVPWPHRLPRYLLSGHVALSAVIGIEIAMQVRWLRGSAQLQNGGWLLLGSLSILLLPVRVFLLMLAGAGYLSSRKPGERRLGWWLSGVGIVGGIYFASAGIVSSLALRDEYVVREHAQAAMTEYAGKQMRAGRTIGFLGDAGDEHIGSMAGALERQGVEIRIRSVLKAEDTSGVNVLLFSQALSPPDALHPYRNLRRDALFSQRKESVKVAVDFWEWRRRLWRRSGGGMVAEREPNDAWAFFSTRR